MANDPYWENTVLLLHGEALGDPYADYLALAFTGSLSTPEVCTTAFLGSSVVQGTYAARPAFALGAATSSWVGVYGSATGLYDADFTVEWWMYLIDIPVGNNLVAIGKVGTTTASSAFCLYFNSSGYWSANVRSSSAGIGTYLPALNTWHHCALDVSSGVVSLYVGEILVGTMSAGTTAAPTVNGICFGRTSDYTNLGFSGYLCYARVYKGLAKFSGATITVPTWPEPAFGRVLDSSSHRHVSLNNSGTSLSTPYLADSMFGGGCLRCDGVSSVKFPAHADFVFGTADFAIEFSMKSLLAWTSQSASCGVIACASGQWCLYRDGSYPTKLNFRSNGHDFPTASTPTANVWESWAFIRVSGVLYIFRDRTLDASYPNADNITVSGPLYIGYAPTWASYFMGLLDNVRITSGNGRITVPGDYVAPTAAFPEGQTTVSGVVRDAIGALCSRRVNVHSRSTGRLLGTAVSDPQTGVFSIGAPEKCYAVALPVEGSGQPALVIDALDPLL